MIDLTHGLCWPLSRRDLLESVNGTKASLALNIPRVTTISKNHHSHFNWLMVELFYLSKELPIMTDVSVNQTVELAPATPRSWVEFSENA